MEISIEVRGTERLTLSADSNRRKEVYADAGLQAVIDKLAAYEDTGFSPEQIEEGKLYVGNAVIDSVRQIDALDSENERLVAERDALARYINTLDIDEDVCKHNSECDGELMHTEAECVACIIRILGHGLEAKL